MPFKFEVEEIKKMKIGDPLDRSTDHGPQNHKLDTPSNSRIKYSISYCLDLVVRFNNISYAV